MRKTYLPLSDEDRNYLKSLSKKRTIQAQVVDRARILLYKADGMTFQEIADKLAISTATVRLCVSKFHKGGVDAALFDVQRPGRPSEITDDAKAWMIRVLRVRDRQNSVMRRNCGHCLLSINTFRNMQRRRDIQDFQQLRNLISRNSSGNRI